MHCLYNVIPEKYENSRWERRWKSTEAKDTRTIIPQLVLRTAIFCSRETPPQTSKTFLMITSELLELLTPQQITQCRGTLEPVYSKTSQVAGIFPSVPVCVKMRTGQAVRERNILQLMPCWEAVWEGQTYITKLLCEGPRRQRSCILRDAFQLMPEQSRHLNFIRALQGTGTEHRRIFLGFICLAVTSVCQQLDYRTQPCISHIKCSLLNTFYRYTHNNQPSSLQTQGSQI